MTTAGVRTLLFDFGNTLVAFGPEQQLAQLHAMEEVFRHHGIQPDRKKLDDLRYEQVMRPYNNNGLENDFETVCREVVELHHPDPEGEITRDIMQARRDAFSSSVSAPRRVAAMLGRLAPHYQLGILSNYPCTLSITSALDHLGLTSWFDAVIVSADVGYAKPHPATFSAALDALSCDPGHTVYIGDNWLADIQGAKRAGLRAVWIQEHIPYEVFTPETGDHPADAELARLADLEPLLEEWRNSVHGTG